MSAWLRLVNELKTRAPQEYFTAAQQTAYEMLADRLQFPNQRVNLYGAAGTGKTYIAWALVRALGAVHVPLPERLRSFAGHDLSVLIIDNAPTYEDDLRTLIAEASLLDAGSIIFLTRRPATLRMHQIELKLPTAEDVRHVGRTYGRLGYYEVSAPPPSPNFWQILQSYV